MSRYFDLTVGTSSGSEQLAQFGQQFRTTVTVSHD